MRVLIVDDRPEASLLALQLVTKSVDTALTAQEAVRALLPHADGYDVVILDLFLPGIEAYGGVLAFVHLVRRLHWGKLVIVSGCEPQMIQEAAEEVGAIALPKPHLVSGLLAACRE